MNEKIQNSIERALSNARIENDHGITAENIDKHLKDPVLEEIPETENGYKIVYDENWDEFGLAMVDNKCIKVFLCTK